MYITIVPTLKCMVLSKIVHTFYYKPEIRALEERLKRPLCFSPPKDWAPTVNEWLSEIFPSRILRNAVVNLFMPISLEVVMWGNDHPEMNSRIFIRPDVWFYHHFEVNSGFLSYVDMWRCFRWNSRGIIDREQTAKLIVSKRNMGIKDRLFLACNYNLKENILEMWENMPEADIDRYINGTSMVGLWFYYLKKGSVLETTHFASASFYSEWGRPSGLRVLFPYMSMEDRYRCLAYSIRRRKIVPDDLRFCLSQLDDNKQIEIYKRHTFWVLKSFLHWPLQSAFLDLVNQMWNFLTISDFRDLLHVMLCQIITKGWEDFDYFYILRHFWRQSPDNLKDSIKKTGIYEPLTIINDYRCPEPFSLAMLPDFKCNCHLNSKVLYIEEHIHY